MVGLTKEKRKHMRIHTDHNGVYVNAISTDGSGNTDFVKAGWPKNQKLAAGK